MRTWLAMGLALALIGAGCDDDGGGMDAAVDAGDLDAGPPTAETGPFDAGPGDTDGGDTDGGDTDGGGGGLTAEQFSDAYVAEVCGLLLDCESKLGPLLGIAVQQICHPEGSGLALEGIDAALAAGTVTFDGTAADACLTSLMGFTCADLIDGLAEDLMCDGVFTPTVAVGNSCAIDAECIDSRCVAGASCPGMCTAFIAAGMPCSDDDECADGLGCSMGMCEALRAAGGACDTEDDCQPGLVCDSNLCAARPTTGQACTSLLGVSTCAGADLCVNDVCGAGGASGAACGGDEPCAPGLRCNPGSGTCVTLVEPGGSCSVDVECPAYFFCNGGSCDPLPVEGESCALSGSCAEGLCMGGTCTRAGLGEACMNALAVPFGTCAPGGYCRASVCTANVVLGVMCGGDNECGEGNECRMSTCREVCTP